MTYTIAVIDKQTIVEVSMIFFIVLCLIINDYGHLLADVLLSSVSAYGLKVSNSVLSCYPIDSCLI